MSPSHSLLDALGWDSALEAWLESLATRELTPARVVSDHGSEYVVHDGEAPRRAIASPGDAPRAVEPAVGDWIAASTRGHLWVIAAAAPRRTVFSRKSAGAESTEQVLAANVDLAFVVAAATDVNPRRIERHLTIAWQSGATQSSC